jgi:hypothetical protein
LALKTNQSLRELILASNFKLFDGLENLFDLEGLNFIVELLKINNNIRALDLSCMYFYTYEDNEVNFEKCKILSSMLQINQGLTKLDLSGK